MMRLTPEREDEIRKLCVGRGMINAHVLYELFEEIRALERERLQLSNLIFAQEKRWRDLEFRDAHETCA